jgi:tripartite ATP-independent transporter DctM subunit
MSELILLTVTVLLFALIFLGLPIGYALFLVAFAGLTFSVGLDVSSSLLWNTIYSQSQAYSFSTIPMFILMALILNQSGMLSDVFESMNKWTSGVIPGGLAIGTTLSNGVFAALSGSSAAASAAIAKIAKPEMEKFGYADTLSMGTIAASGTFAMMFPPSLGLIIYGVITNTSISRLFIAGILPGILTVTAYVVLIVAWVKYDPSIAGSGGATERFSWTERIKSTYIIWPAGLLIVLVLGSIYSGVVTPTEAGALGAAGALVIGILLYGLSRTEFNNALTETASITAYVFVIVIGAKYFGRYIAIEGVIDDILTFLLNLPVGELGILLIVLALYLVLGMFLNQVPILVLTLPITFPIFVEELGFSALWFGIVIIKTVEIGMITPPIGINVYIASNAVDVDASTTFRGAAPFILADVLVLALLIAFPQIVSVIPQTMG